MRATHRSHQAKFRLARLAASAVLMGSTLVVAAAMSNAAPSLADGGVGVGLPVGVPAGNYLLTVSGLVATAPTTGVIAQQIGGSGPLLRTAEFFATTSPTTVTAQVRVAGPSDVFSPVGDSATAIWTSATLTAANWSYLVRGQSITSPGGAGVAWHGVNAHLSMTDQDYANLATTYPQAKAVRIFVNEECWDPFFTAAQATALCHKYDVGSLTGSAAYQAHIQQAVTSITSRGQVAVPVVDIAGRDTPSWIPPTQVDRFGPDQESLVVYDQLAGLFKDNPSVVFETTNEPKINATNLYPPNNVKGDELWANGGIITVTSMTWNMPGVQQIVDHIRAAGASNLILIDGTSYAANLLAVEAHPVLGTNLAYAFHGYAVPDTSTQYPPGFDTHVFPLIDPNGPYKYAAMLTEFGTVQTDTSGAASAYLQSCITWANTHGVGWMAYAWYPISYDHYGLLNSYRPLSLTSRGSTVVSNF